MLLFFQEIYWKTTRCSSTEIYLAYLYMYFILFRENTCKQSTQEYHSSSDNKLCHTLQVAVYAFSHKGQTTLIAQYRNCRRASKKNWERERWRKMNREESTHQLVTWGRLHQSVVERCDNLWTSCSL